MKKHFLICASILLSVSCASVDEDSNALPQRYLQLGLEPVDQVVNFEFQDFDHADAQSVIVRTRSREAYLLVLDKPGHHRNDDVYVEHRNLRPGFSRVCFSMMGISTPKRWAGNCLWRRLEVIYQLRDEEHEYEVVKFLRAND